MIQLENKALTPYSTRFLAKKQAKINALPNFADRVALAKSSWKNKSRDSVAFTDIVEKLETISPGPIRCVYCEDSRADEIEHIDPKNFFPAKTFLWENYCYACGPCNGPKNDQCAVYRTVDNQKVNHDVFVNGQPPVGTSVLINPRTENPMGFLKLSLQEFVFRPLNSDPDSRSHERALYTIDILRLNERDELVEQREDFFTTYTALLGNYAQRFNWRRSIKRLQHRTVWKEMQRQRTTLNPDGTFAYPQLHALFTAAPEALNW
jgi:hypothetical protein